MPSGRRPKPSAGNQGLVPTGISSFGSPLSPDGPAHVVHPNHITLVPYLRHTLLFLSFFKCDFYLLCCAGSSLLHGLFSSCWEQGLLFVSVRGLLLLQSTGSRCTGFSSCGTGLGCCGSPPLETSSVGVVHGLSCSQACGIFPDQGWNLCHLHWQLDSLPLSRQGSPHLALLFFPIFALPTVSHAHSHILYLGISYLIFKASSDLTFSGKPSMVAPGRIHTVSFSPLRNDYSCFCYYLSAYLLILGVSHPGPKAASPAGPGQGCRAAI